MRSIKIFGIVVMLVCSAIFIKSSSAPAGKHKIEGWVLDSGHVGVKGVYVWVTSGNKGNSRSQLATDTDGHFTVDFDELSNSIDVFYDAKDTPVGSLTLEGLSGRRGHTFTKVLIDKSVARTAREADEMLTTASRLSAVEWPDQETTSRIKEEQTRMLRDMRIDTTSEPVNRLQLWSLYMKQGQIRQLYGLNPTEPLRDAGHNPIAIEPIELLTKEKLTGMIDELRQMPGIVIDRRLSSGLLAEKLLKTKPSQWKFKESPGIKPNPTPTNDSWPPNINRPPPGNVNRSILKPPANEMDNR